MKKFLLAAIAATAFVLAPAVVNTAAAQTVVKERTVVRGHADHGWHRRHMDRGWHRGHMHRGHMYRGHMYRGQRCFKERTRIYRNGRHVTIVKRVCR